MADEAELLLFAEKFKPNITFRDRINSGDGEYLVHVLGVFDKDYVAVKYYGKHKQWWHYEFLDVWTLYAHYCNGMLKFTS